MKKLVTLLIILLVVRPQYSLAQLTSISFEQVDSLRKTEKRPVVIFLHTTWCRYCDAMKHTTFKDAAVQKLLSEKFYFISFNAEEKRNVSFRGHTFRYNPTGTTTGVHQLAEQLGTSSGVLAYPALCILNADYEIIYQAQGYIKAKELLGILEKLH